MVIPKVEDVVVVDGLMMELIVMMIEVLALIGSVVMVEVIAELLVITHDAAMDRLQVVVPLIVTSVGIVTIIRELIMRLLTIVKAMV